MGVVGGMTRIHFTSTSAQKMSASLVHISQRIKVETMENPDLAESGAHWRKLWPLIWVFTLHPSLTGEGA